MMDRLGMASTGFVGQEQVIRELNRLGRKLGDRTARRALTRAGAIYRRQARQGARRIARTGQLAKAIGTRVKRYRTQNTVFAAVGVRQKFSGAREKISPWRYAHLVERGTRRTEPKWIFRRAFDATERRMLQTIETELRNAILGRG